MPRKKSSKRINIDTREKWKNILKTVSKDDVPMALLEMVTVNLIDGTQVDINVTALLEEGHDPDEIEIMINSRLKKLDEIIRDVDIFINIDSVAKTVQPVTDNILKHL
jgi:hypothetical protein